MKRATAVGVALAVVAVGAVASGPPAVAADPFTTYVTAVYRDLLGRAPDPEGLATWTSALTRMPTQSVANSITHSEEFRSHLITDAYRTYLGRGPDAQGLRFWLDQMGRGWTIAQIDSGFISSDEYYAANGNDPVRWVASMYQEVLGRPAADAEVQWWAARLGRDGVTRASTALGILLSTEHLSAVVDGYYRKLLGRGLDPSGQQTWVGLLQDGTHDEDIIGGIVASYEYWTNNVPASAYQPPAPPDPHPPTGIYVYGGTTTSGTHVTLTAVLVDADHHQVRDVTGEAAYTISSGGTCSANTCWASASGDYVVTARWGSFSNTNTLHVDHGPAVSAAIAVNGLGAPGGNLPAGASTAITVVQTDAAGNRWDGTAGFTVKVDGTPCAAVCGPFEAGSHTATAAPVLGSGSLTPVTFAGRTPTVAGMRLFGADIDQEGHGTAPTQIGTGTWWASLAATDFGAVARRSDGSVWSWALDQGQSASSTSPGWTAGTQTVSSVFDVPTGTFAQFVPGGLKAWGSNAHGELGTGSADVIVRTPTAVAGVAGTTWKTVVGDEYFNLGLTSDGELWAWGDNGYGTFGDPSAPSSRVPVRIGTEHWKSIAAGWWTAVGVRSDGTLWEWGTGLDGEPRVAPRQVGTASNWASVDGSDWNFAGLTTSQELWTWFGSVWADPADRLPVKVSTPATWKAVAVTYGRWSGIAADGSLWTGDIFGGAGAPTRLGQDVGWVDVQGTDDHVFALRP